MAENANEILLGHLKSIRAKFGDQAVEDPKILSALLGAEAPELRDKIDAFIALLRGADAPPPGAGSKGAAAAAAHRADLQEKTPAPSPEVSEVSVAPVKPSVPVEGAARWRRYRVPALVALVLVIGAGFFIYVKSTPSGPGPSISITSDDSPVPPRPPTSHKGEQFADNFDNGPPEKMFGGALLIGRNGPWEGRVDQDGYHLTGTSPSNLAFKSLTPSFSDNKQVVPVDSIEADVSVDGSFPDSAVGLEFNKSESSAYWFVITKGGKLGIVSVSYQPKGGVTMGSSQSLQVATAKSGWNRLKIQMKGNAAEFFVNGQSVGSQSDSSVQGADAGLIAIGAGNFRFRKVVRVLG